MNCTFYFIFPDRGAITWESRLQYRMMEIGTILYLQRCTVQWRVCGQADTGGTLWLLLLLPIVLACSPCNIVYRTMDIVTILYLPTLVLVARNTWSGFCCTGIRVPVLLMLLRIVQRAFCCLMLLQRYCFWRVGDSLWVGVGEPQPPILRRAPALRCIARVLVSRCWFRWCSRWRWRRGQAVAVVGANWIGRHCCCCCCCCCRRCRADVDEWRWWRRRQCCASLFVYLIADVRRLIWIIIRNARRYPLYLVFIYSTPLGFG